MIDDFAAVGRIRATFICGLVLTLLLGLSVRLVQLQIIDGPTYAAESLEQLISERTLEAPRGRILDRHGAPLAISRPCWTVFADPSGMEGVEGRREVAQALARVLDLDTDDLAASFEKDPDASYVRVMRRIVDEKALAAVRKLGLINCVGIDEESMRVYPCGSLAAHVLGVASPKPGAGLGVEQWRDADLRGTDGKRRALRDSGRKAIVGMLEGDRRPVPGRDVRLTIDRRIQCAAESAVDEIIAEWAPEGVCVVLMDPKNGDVLAMVNRPDFDPHRPRSEDVDRWRNRVVCDRYTPGSTLKPLLAAAALDAGVVRLEDTIDCENGSWTFPSRTLRDAHGHGVLSVRDVVVKSSNIGMAKIAGRFGVDATVAALKRFGIYRPTGLGFPGEAKDFRVGLEGPRKDVIWYLPSVAMGQQITVTPLQLARGFCAIAAGGMLPTPRLFVDTPLGPRTRAISAPVAADMLETLGQVVERGTGKRAKLERWRVGGKTGTAELMAGPSDDETDRPGRPAASAPRVEGHVSSFVGVAPIEDPRFVVVVMTIRPQNGDRRPYGGTVSGPAAAKILEAALSLHGVEESHGR